MKKFIFAFIALISMTTLIGCDGKEVIVSFEENGGEAIADITVIQESTMSEPLAIREGYTFEGWYQEIGLTTLFDFDSKIIRNIDLFAKWSINSYSVTFISDNDTDDIIISDDYSSTITFPVDPEKTGYEFGGWYLDEVGTNEFTSNRIPSADTIVYAYWIQNQYTVNFYIDSDTIPAYTETVLYGEPVENAPAIPVVTGSDGVWSEDITSITSDIDVYVEYTKKVFSITFQDFEGNTYSTLTLEYGVSITSPSTPERVGYDFIGYYSPLLERNIDLINYTVTEDLVLEDSFKIQSFSVKFYGGETGTLLGDVQYIDYGLSAQAPTEGIDRDGYTFTDWDITFDTITMDINVYAEYTINQYTAAFDANGGVYLDETGIINVTQDYNSNVIVPEVPTKDGFIFVGWYLDLNYNVEKYFGTGIPLPIDGLTVYAKWLELVATRYTVEGTYYYEEEGIEIGGLSTDGIYTQTSFESYIPFINVLYDTDMSPVRDIEGYEFFKYVYNGQDYFDEDQLLTITQDETVDVYYRRIVLSVSFSDQVSGESIVTKYYVYYNDSLTNVPIPTPVTGMTVAWEQQNFDNIKTNLSVVAIQYDNSLQTVIFRSNGTIIYIATNEDDTYPYALVISAKSPLWSIQQNGYRFLGWFIAGTDTLVASGDLLYSANYFDAANITTIEARWVELSSLNSVSDVSIEADTANKIITIDFTVIPNTIDGVDIYPIDYIFILNGEYIQSSDVLNFALIDYVINSGNDFTLTLDETNPFYDFFKENLMSAEDDYQTLIPGTHTLQIISVGDNYNVMSSNPSDAYQYKVESIYEGIPESSTIKDYYIIEDFGSGALRYIFYSNLTYQFEGMTFNIETGSNHITADDNKLITTSIPGEFRFTITDDAGSRTYDGLVVKDIRQFDIGSSYQNYLTQVNADTEDDSFLADTIGNPYFVGANNGFYIDALIRDNNGAKISLDDVLINYEFYMNGSETPLDETNLKDYVSLVGNVMYFTNAAVGVEFRIVVEPKYESTLMDMDALEYNILVNDGYNAFTNDDLKVLYSDLNVNHINIHRDIDAALSSNQMYEDGSPRNFFARPNNDYTNYGNVYYRINGNTDDDQITIEGNFMTIDGSNIGYINPDLEGSGTIGYAKGFDIVSTQIGIFYYNVYQSEPVNNNQFTMNNLKIVGNTTTPSVNYGGTEEEIYNQERLMSKNSGGMLGVIVRSGKASLNNLVIGYTVIGVTTNAYGENSDNEVLTVDLDYVSIYDSWANSIYLHGGSGLSVDNSSIASSGGAAIHFEDTHPGLEVYDNPALNLGDNNEINNWISGQESWFKAYAMSSIALALKSNINNSVAGLGKTVIQMTENPVSGLNTEMMNLVFLSLPVKSAVTLLNPDDKYSVITASEVTLNIADSTGVTILERNWDFTNQLFPINPTTAIGDPRISGGQYGFALGSLSDTYAFLSMIGEIMTMSGGAVDQATAGNLAAIAGFYNLSAADVLQVAGYIGAGNSVQDSVLAVKKSLDYAQPHYIEVVAPIGLTGAAGNATILIEMFNITEEE